MKLFYIFLLHKKSVFHRYTVAICIFLQFIVCLPLTSRAFFSENDKGTSAGEFLKLGAGARAAGMGEAYSAAADKADAIYWNPAGLIQIKNRSAIFTHASLFEGISYEFIGYGQKLKNAGAFGIGIQYLSAGTIKETDSSGFETGSSFSPKDISIAAAYSRLIGEFSFGISGKYIRSKIIKTASTFAADMGILSPELSQKKMRLSFVIQNLGGKLKFDQKSDPLPFNIKMGSAISLKENWIGAMDINFPRDNKPYLALGTEYWISYDDNWNFAGRLGFNSKTAGDIVGFSGFSFGLGTKFKQIELDYALLPFGSLGLTHRISLGIDF